jgi:crossover junction endodeoxyribonuclease RusA
VTAARTRQTRQATESLSAARMATKAVFPVSAPSVAHSASSAQESASVFVVVLPYPPSLNHLWRRVGSKTLLSAEGRRYHELVGAFVKIIRSQGSTVPGPPHRVTMLATPPDRRRRDLDNLLKASLDPVYRAIGHDDSEVEALSIAWNRDGGHARLEVHIEPLADAAPDGED